MGEAGGEVVSDQLKLGFRWHVGRNPEAACLRMHDDAGHAFNPAFWRQWLALADRLFEVCEGIYQVRGADLSNMTIVEGDEGVLVIDPLI